MDLSSELHKIRFYITDDGFYAETDGDGKLASNFDTDRYLALYNLGFGPSPDDYDPTGRFLVSVASDFINILSRQPDIELTRHKTVIRPDDITAGRILNRVPFVDGCDKVNAEWIEHVFAMLNESFAREIEAFDGSVSLYLAGKDQDLTVPERIFFHLVENDSIDFPFAFLATYGTKLKNGRIKHVPLKYALTEYKHNNAKLLELLSCLNKVADISPLLGKFIASGEMFHPLGLTIPEAYELLTVSEAIEQSGVVFRVPNWWRRKAYSPCLTLSLGEDKPSYVGLNTIIDIKPHLTVDGVELTVEEVQRLLDQTEGLSLIKGKWVSIDHGRLRELLAQIGSVQGSMTLLEAIRQMGIGDANKEASPDVGRILTNGEWLNEVFTKIHNPDRIRKTLIPTTVKATLRPYQKDGYEWLRYMNKLKFGACLADDMGLGKTLQVLSFLEYIRKQDKNAKILLIVPASLIGNWVSECGRFVPSMPLGVIHGIGSDNIRKILEYPEQLPFLSITTYGMVARNKEFRDVSWSIVILDEAQAIKNPTTKQTQAVKKLTSGSRIAMTGTPIENDLTNLWSLFDFLNKGLLGSSKEFTDFTKSLSTRPEGYSKLRNMVSPFMLRRVKTDKKIISDLPDKIETVDYVAMSSKQSVLYRKYVDSIEQKIRGSEGVERRGNVLAAIIKLKQICNHPDEYLGQDTYLSKESGKFEMLRELCETIVSKRERVLVFTQFKEIIPYLDDHLANICGRRGLVLHGDISPAKRTKLVEQFQGEYYIPYMVISVKAGGTGLNLTKANHVIHFDRWWNPAVEDQATDRAFRIGQNKKVIVHKFVCRNTIEERIDMMMRDKSDLADKIIGSGGENWITKLSDDELMNVLRMR